MEAMQKLRIHGWWLVALALTLCCLAGCNDDGADPIAQQPPAGGSKRESKAPKAAKKELPGDPAGGPGAEAANEEAAPAEEEYTGPKVDVTILECKAPYPEFTGKGRYTMKVEVSSVEYIERAVWDILFLDGDGKEVAKDRQELKIPMGDHPMVLKFSSLFCLSQPASVELRKTELTATTAGAQAQGGGGQEGSSAGGGEASGNSVGGGSKSGGKSSGGGKSGGGGGAEEEEDGGGGDE